MVIETSEREARSEMFPQSLSVLFVPRAEPIGGGVRREETPTRVLRYVSEEESGDRAGDADSRATA
jgi:hypothetical protein